jgi:hypothetical protein
MISDRICGQVESVPVDLWHAPFTQFHPEAQSVVVVQFDKQSPLPQA